MASQKGQRVRLVKCPKCLKILQEDEDVPVYQCGGCSAILQAKRRSIALNTTPSPVETEETTKTNEPVSSSSRQDMVLPSSSGHEYKNGGNEYMESVENQLGELELSHGNETSEIKQQEGSLGDSEKNKEEESTRLEPDMMMMNTVVVEAARSEDSSGRLSVDNVVAARASNGSGNADPSTDASPIEEKQTKTSSAYDGSESSPDEKEDRLLDENEQWNALRSGKFEMPRYHEAQGASSSSTFSERRRNETTTYREQYQNMSLQLEGRGGRLGRQGRRHVTEQLRPIYPREPYTRVSPSYPSHDEYDRYSRAHSLQMPPYSGGRNYESADFIYHNNIRTRGEDQRGIRYSGEMASERRSHAGWYSGQLHNSSYTASPQIPMEQPEYYQRWSSDMVSDVEDHQRGHHHELVTHRQCVAKRHVRPTAGGAPFISCYQCSENLQLPVDFLIFKRKHHLLRCGTCTTVLRFSLHSGTHLVPAVTYDDTNANRSPISSSESPTAKPNAETLSSPVQDENLPVARGSPLHRLLGYSTVSQVFKASKRPPSL